MRKGFIVIVALALNTVFTANAQVSINSDGSAPDASAMLEVKSTEKGFLLPRMSTAQMNAITSPTAGLMVFNTTVNSAVFYDGTTWKATFNRDGESCGDVTYGGQTYQTVVIGTQCWMSENLNVGTMINGDVHQTDNDTIEKYCFGDDTVSCDTYGGLYQWNEMMQYAAAESTQGICPTGWHLPSDNEYKTLEIYLGMSPSDADIEGWRGTDEASKLAGNESLWIDGELDQNANFGLSGFDGLPGGWWSFPSSWIGKSTSSFFWTSSGEEEFGTNAWFRSQASNSTQISRSNAPRTLGYSVRCVKD